MCSLALISGQPFNLDTTVNNFYNTIYMHLVTQDPDDNEYNFCIINRLRNQNVFDKVNTNVFDMSDVNQIYSNIRDYLDDADEICDKFGHFFKTPLGIILVVVGALIVLSTVVGCIRCLCCM
jgi:hypothetical protein